jgi:hypothetical protein
MANIFSGILSFCSSLINLKAANKNERLAEVMEKESTEVQIENNNKNIESNNIEEMAKKIHDFSALTGEEEKIKNEKTSSSTN